MININCKIIIKIEKHAFVTDIQKNVHVMVCLLTRKKIIVTERFDGDYFLDLYSETS
jgi:hypothetical protein